MFRVEKTGGSYPTETIYFQGKPIALLNATSGAWTDLIWAGGGLIAEVAGTQTALPSYRLLDHEGSLAMTTDGSGNVTGTNVFLPFGELLSSTTSDSFQFTGLPQDTENSSYHARFRDFSTAQGRWLSPDPYNGIYDITNPQSFNRYSYVNNNPLAFVDPSGLEQTCISFPGITYSIKAGGTITNGQDPPFVLCTGTSGYTGLIAATTLVALVPLLVVGARVRPPIPTQETASHGRSAAFSNAVPMQLERLAILKATLQRLPIGQRVRSPQRFYNKARYSSANQF